MDQLHATHLAYTDKRLSTSGLCDHKTPELCHPQTVCAIITGFLHYFFLAAFTWMFLEGLHLILTVRNLKVVNYTSARKFKKRYMYPFGYGLPASIVAISVAANPAGYGTSEQ